MPRYLVVAHQTAESPELREALRGLVQSEPEAEFDLLVPSTPPASLLVWEEGEAREVASRRAAQARKSLTDAGFRFVAARVGDPNPLDAIRDELREHGPYTGIVVSTLPRGVSSWLRMDLVGRLRRVATHYPVIHDGSSVQAQA